MDFEPDPIQRSTPFTVEELHFLHLLARRAFQTVNLPNTLVALETPAAGRVPPPKISIATLAFRVPDPENHLIKPGQGSCKGCEEAKYEQVEFDLKNEPTALGPKDILEGTRSFLQSCLERGMPPQFALLNELAISYKDRAVLEAGMKGLAKEFGVYIVAGSYHDPESYYNFAPVFSPVDKERRVRKHLAARVQGERIRTPDFRELEIVRSDYGNFLVWICLDMYDPALVLKFLNASNRFTWGRPQRTKLRKDLDFVFIPSFNGDSETEIRESVRLMSRFSKVALFCANACTLKGARRLETFGYLGGEELDPTLTEPVDLGAETSVSGKLFCLDRNRLHAVQAADFLEDGTYSSQFSAVIKGGYAFREVPM